MTRFRPCIDLHDGHVKQIVGGTLLDSTRPRENHVSDRPASWFADRYRRDGLTGGHVIKLGPGNEDAAREALAAHPGGLQIGGGINADNAAAWIEAGASHVIVTSWLFDSSGNFLSDRLERLVNAIGRDRIVIDLSCRRIESAGRPAWRVAMNRWQTMTNVAINRETLSRLSDHADEFLIHAADVEGLCDGIDDELVALMGNWRGIPMTYAGGIASLGDIRRVADLSDGFLDFTVGSALNLFGGTAIDYEDLLGTTFPGVGERGS